MPSYNIDFPAECDDGYWLNPITPFQQPPGAHPSLLSFFNHQIHLTDIMSLALRLNKSANMYDTEIAQVGEKMQKWFNDIPEHCKFTPSFYVSDTRSHINHI